MKHSNAIPRSLDPLISLGVKVLAGAIRVGESAGLRQNTAINIAEDLHGLTGDPAAPSVPGAQAQYAAHGVVLKEAYAASRVAINAGREFCRLAIGVLKPVLGVQWNTRWNAAGFAAPSLALGRDPVPMLIRFREYFNANGAREVAALEFTAAQADLLVAGIQQAGLAIGQARAAHLLLKRARDGAQARLRARLSGLRAELDQLITDADGRWYDFGFCRPADGRVPGPVAEVVVTPAGAAMVFASWPPVPRAHSYRVTWRLAEGGLPPVLAGLFADTQCAIPGLPSGTTVVIGVSARNGSGESAAAEATIAVG